MDVGTSDENGGGKRPQPQPQPQQQPQPQPQSTPTTFGIHNLPYDPSDRPRITTYHRPCQPKEHLFPITKIGKKNRRFVKEWFDEFNWLEYSKKKQSLLFMLLFVWRQCGSKRWTRCICDGRL